VVGGFAAIDIAIGMSTVAGIMAHRRFTIFAARIIKGVATGL
jgi:hypothetical protein